MHPNGSASLARGSASLARGSGWLAHELDPDPAAHPAGTRWQSREVTPAFAIGDRGLRYRTAMHRIVLSAALLVTSIFAACGGPATQGPSTASTASPGAGGGVELGPGPDTVCHEETKTGSSISHQVCRSKDQSADDRRGAQDMLGASHATAPPH